MENGIVTIVSLFIAYFLACEFLKRQEVKLGTNEQSYLWTVWFACTLLIKSTLDIAWIIYVLVLGSGLNNEILANILIAIVLFVAAVAILRRNTIAWFLATLLTLNFIVWAFNTVYFFRVKKAFDKI